MPRSDADRSVRVAGADLLPLAASDRLAVACGPGGCPSTCCKNGPPVVLNPYEIARICAADGISYEDLLDIVETERSDGFPLVLLLRDPVCHFWTETGCSVYEGRPLACRLFPLGRVFESGASHLVLPDQNRCSGLMPDPTGTVAGYLQDQDTGTFMAMADEWIEFVSDMERLPLPDRAVTSVAFHVLVYDPEAPTGGGADAAPLSIEQRFLRRLESARQQLPRFLRIPSS